MAKGLHFLCQRLKHSYYAFPISAMLQSELFGYAEGTFTGGQKGGKKGKLEIADGGTLFLDEIGEMPLDMQVSLLRFLQDKIVIRIGGNDAKKVDVRIIAATNRNLWDEIHDKKFRLDIYYRLNEINIKMPPLKHRKADHHQQTLGV
ncbi:MAG: sigma 54-interacting transcriptional regulator [Desulfitobacteriaceae bacterium]